MQPLVVEREASPASGLFEIDDRLATSEVRLGRDDVLSSAWLEVRLDADFTAADAMAAFAVGGRVRIRTDEAEASRRTVLFEGYVPITEAAWETKGAQRGETCRVLAEHVAGRWALATLVTGRWMRSRQAEQVQAVAVPEPGLGAVHVDSPSCLFNFDSRSNCATSPIAVVGSTGNSREIYVFAGDGDPYAKPWTFARAIRYIAWFHRGGGESAGLASLMAATEAAAVVDADAIAPAGLDDAGVLLARPATGVSCEGMNAVEAILTLARAAGVHVCIEPQRVGDVWETGWRFYSTDGTAKRLRLRGTSAGASDAQVLVDNNVSSARLVRDERRIVHQTVVVGGVPTVEMTAPLAPGWLPVEGVDNVGAMDRASAKAMALTPSDVYAQREQAPDDAWFQRFHAAGAQHALFAAVGRRWVLNEDGRYDATDFDRHAPFDAYTPFDFTTVLSDSSVAARFFVRRARRFLPAVSATRDGAPLGVWVEISFDGGATWQHYTGALRIPRDECAITFDFANPAGVAPPGVDPREQNLWYALIDQAFRVRVTASIETDERLATGSGIDAMWRGAAWHRRAWGFEPELFERHDVASADSALATIDAPPLPRDDGAVLAHAETAASQLNTRNAINGGPCVPWVDLEYRIGDRIDGIEGWGAAIADGGGFARTSPVVAGKVYRLSGGRYETELLLAGS